MSSRFVATLFCALSLFCGRKLSAQTPVWSQFPSSPSGTTRNDDVFFINPTNGWTARETDGVYRTLNGGNTWTKVLANTNTTALFRCIGFVSPSHGWVGNLGPGSFNTSVSDTNVLYETLNGGIDWTPVAAVNNSGMKGFCAMHVRDAQHIYGAGRVRGPAYFVKSEDAGTNWYVTNLTAAGVMGGLMDIYFKDATNGFVVGMDANLYTNNCTFANYHGAIAQTTNGGLSWHVVANTTVNCSYFWKMSWPSPNVGYASLQQNGSYNTVIYYKTIDGGATWSSNGIPLSAIGSPASFFLQGIGFVSENEGWMGGTTALNPPFSFIHTTNGGGSWTSEGYNNTRGMNRIRFLSPTLGFGSGQTIHVYRVPLLITTHPTNQTVTPGTNTSFAVVAQGATQLAYQWRFNVTNNVGANTNVLALANIQSANVGNYDVVVSDYSGAVTSSVATLTLDVGPVAPSIITDPQSLSVMVGQNAPFTVAASGSGSLSYQWRFNGVDLPGATQASYTRFNAQVADAGDYSVVVTNNVGSVTSAVATLTVNAPVILFEDNFDQYSVSNVVTAAGTNNGYKIVYRAAGGVMDFQAVFGFDYSSITYPTTIPSAPRSTNGTTRGLYLTVNKDANGQAAAVNLYPTNQLFSGNFALKFDLWINWSNVTISTEHTLFGINHSGTITNRIGQSPSDGLYFAVAGDDDSLPTSLTLRDYSVFRGNGASTPILMITNNTGFGPAPLLSPQFENYESGFPELFPAQNFPGFGNTPPGVAGMRWLRGEVRQLNQRITWLLNDAIIAQYTNNYAYTNGNIMLGYNDNFASVGGPFNFAIFDNIRVERLTVAPVTMLTPRIEGGNFVFSFVTEPYESYTVQRATNFVSAVWLDQTNFLGNGNIMSVQMPLLPGTQNYFRVRRP